jgi:bifunctional DNase/RNase
MIEVVIDSIRVSLMSQHRVVILKDINSERLLPIWIGPHESEAITNELQNDKPSRPMTHDLLKSTITELGGRIIHVYISEISSDVYYARLVIEVNGKQVEIDSRSSDAIALAIRAKVPMFVMEDVFERASIVPDEDIQHQLQQPEEEPRTISDDKLSAFADFVNSLDLDLEDDDDK